jgi:release factor glutamine methyltransferase
MKINSILHTAVDRLKKFPTPKLDVEILLSHVVKQPRSYLYAHPEYKLTALQLRKFNQLLSRREAGEPIAYLVGQCEFWSLTLHVNHDVLIPRPDTELLVAEVLKLFAAQQKITVADLGTGSGAIALAIANERPNWKIVATDVSSAALKVAAKNRKNLGIKNVQFKLSDWCNALKNNYFDIIVSNPPYIASDDEHLVQLRFEPINALVAVANKNLCSVARKNLCAMWHAKIFAPCSAQKTLRQVNGAKIFAPYNAKRSAQKSLRHMARKNFCSNGLCAYHKIISQAKEKLKTNGYLLLEHGYQQAAAVQEIFLQHGYKNIQTYRDFSGNERVTVGRL